MLGCKSKDASRVALLTILALDEDGAIETDTSEQTLAARVAEHGRAASKMNGVRTADRAYTQPNLRVNNGSLSSSANTNGANCSAQVTADSQVARLREAPYSILAVHDDDKV